MSNGAMGAATAAPAVVNGDELALADQWEADALDAIEQVQGLGEAEELLAKVATVEQAMRLSKASGDRERRWRGIRLKAEARYGELLPPKQHGGDRRSDQVTGGDLKPGADRMAQSRARQTAEIKQTDPDGFKDYTENDPAPSRAGLKRKIEKAPPKDKPKRSKRHKAGEPTFKPGTTLAYDDTVIQWVRDRVRRGWTREQIMDATKAGTDGWPGAKAIKSERDFGEVKLAIYYIERLEADRLKARLRKAKTPEARMRALREATPPNSAELLQVSSVVSDLVYRLDSIDVEDYDLDDLATHALTTLFEDLMYLGEWWDRTLAAIQARLGDLPLVQRIEKLRAVTVENGAEPAEAASAQRRAAILQRKLDNRLGT